MLYAILCYNDESAVWSWTKDEEDACMARLVAVQDKLASEGRLEPPLVIDGPFAETKEQLLGFYVVDCAALDEALQVARDLGKANPGGAYEIRPLLVFRPGDLAA